MQTRHIYDIDLSTERPFTETNNEIAFQFSPLDIDECAPETNPCDVNANCSNSEGSYSCRCREGFDGDGKNCKGIFLGPMSREHFQKSESFILYLLHSK